MSRIRTTKPDLWTDPDFIDVSFPARLLFIAAKNFASDYGVMPDKPKQLKLQCFPGDDIDIDALVDELVNAGLWDRRTAPDGAKVLVVRAFNRHERVDKPTPGRWGDPAKWSDQPPAPPTTPDDSGAVASAPEDSCVEGKGREGISLSSSRRLTVVPNPPSSRERTHVVKLIVDALLAARTKPPDSERAWRKTVEADVRARDGELIDRMLADNDNPDQIAQFVLGYGKTAEEERKTVDWCTTNCDTCGGDSWIRTDQGLAPCPGRTS